MSGSVTGRMGYRADRGTVMPGRIVVNTTRESSYFVYARQPLANRVTSELPVIRPRSGNTMRHIVTNLAFNIRGYLPRHFSELAVFDARLYIRVRRVDQPA